MSKVATKPKLFSIRDSYGSFADALLADNPDLTYKRAHKLTKGAIYNPDGSLHLDYKKYRDILALYFIKAGIKLIYGYALDLEAGLGDLFVMRQGRNPALKPRLNKGESFKRKRLMEERGEEVTKDNWKIYYTDEEFTRTNWMRPSYVKNLIFYKFSPAGGQPGKGFKQTMSRAISSNPNLLALYPFVPYKIKNNGI